MTWEQIVVIALLVWAVIHTAMDLQQNRRLSELEKPVQGKDVR